MLREHFTKTDIGKDFLKGASVPQERMLATANQIKTHSKGSNQDHHRVKTEIVGSKQEPACAHLSCPRFTAHCVQPPEDPDNQRGSLGSHLNCLAPGECMNCF